MAFKAAGLNCIAVGPTKLYIYSTADTITSSPTGQYAEFNTGNCPGMNTGDIVIIAHNSATILSMMCITGINAASVSFTEVSELS